MDISLIIIILIIFGIPGIMAVYLTFRTVTSVSEELYMRAFNKPIYVHFYPKKKELAPSQQQQLRDMLPFYNRLSERHKAYFRHRVARFIENHEFIGKEGFTITNEVRTKIAATAVMLTFGMRKYLFKAMDKIIVYPAAYLSTITDEYHKGEFNPKVKAVVFSWEDFVKGFETGNDNVNLGIHEFSHVVHYHGTKREDSSAILFARLFKRITDDLSRPANRQRLLDSNYFRGYGYTNKFEFLAVIIEHYFETPQEFRQEFPELYRNVSLMLNHKHHSLNS